MMATVTQSTTQKLRLQPGDSVAVSTSPNVEGSVTVTPSGAGFAGPSSGPTATLSPQTYPVGPVAFSRTFGPYPMGADVEIYAARGSITYNVVGSGLARIDATARPLDPSGRVSQQLEYSDIAGTATIWLPLQDPRSASLVVDYGAQVYGNVVNPGALLTCWGFLPGLSFDGTQYLPLIGGAQAGFNQQAKHIADLTTLATRGDMLVVWFVMTQKTNPSAGTVVSWGMSADPANKGGWAIGVNGAGKILFSHTPQGAGGTLLNTPINTDTIRGKANDNGRTAVCLEIEEAANGTHLEIRAYQQTMTTEGDISQKNYGVDFAAKAATGTGVVGASPTSPLMIGGWNSVNTSTQINLMPSKSGLVNIGLQRRPSQPGLGMRIVKDLRDNLLDFPKSARI